MKIRHRAWLSRKVRVTIAVVAIAAGYHWFGVVTLSVVVLAFLLYELLVPPPRYRQFGSGQQQEAVDNSMGHAGGSYLERGPAYDFPPKVGRNEPCPCGSGRKYKRCCGAVETEA